jgi:hypothetical protein
MGRIIDFNDEFNEFDKRKNEVKRKTVEANNIQDENSRDLDDLQNELDSIMNAHKVEQSSNISLEDPSPIKWEDRLFIEERKDLIEERLHKEIFKNPKLLPELSALEWSIVGAAATIAALLDIILVRTPNGKMTFELFGNKLFNFGAYSDSFHPTTFIKSNLGVDEQGELNGFLKWMEKVCKVPYDQSINPDIAGFAPKTHRMLNLGHDPLLGLFFGIFDTFNGSMTAIDINGKLHVVKTFVPDTSTKLLSPLVWLGHLVSDLCTKMGLPIPGWGFTQLLQFGSFGEKDRTIADITRYMYLKGYDVRHFAAMSIVPGTIELIIRAYHLLSNNLNKKEELFSPNQQTILYKETEITSSNMKMHKMLFFSHLIATSGNALKIFGSGNHPLALNLPQWIAFVKECQAVSKIVTRDKKPEMIIRNRNKINEEWDNILNKEN